MQADKVLIFPTRQTLVLFWALLNIKFYDQYSSFSLFVFSARSRRLVCPLGDEVGEGLAPDPRPCGKAVAAGSSSMQHGKLAPEPSRLSVPLRPTLREVLRSRHGLAQQVEFSNKALKINVTHRLGKDCSRV